MWDDLGGCSLKERGRLKKSEKPLRTRGEHSTGSRRPSIRDSLREHFRGGRLIQLKAIGKVGGHLYH